MRDVVVIGVGMHRFGRHPDTTIGEMGKVAMREALDDAGLGFGDVQAAFCGVANLGYTPGTRVIAEMGNTGMPIVNVDNASASGSSAFYLAYRMVANGECTVAMALGVGKTGRVFNATLSPDPIEERLRQARGLTPPAGSLALVARRRMHEYGASIDHFAKVSVKNHKHGAYNPYAQFQHEVTIDEVHAARMIADPMTVLHCCPSGDGAAAAILCSRAKAEQLGADPVITVAAAAFRSEVYSMTGRPSFQLTEATARAAYEQAGCGPEDIDLVQVHDAFSVEEIEFYESLGFCPCGEGERLIDNGDTEIGGRVPFSTDGGLLARGHPIGPTGLAQIWENVMQLRGRAGQRQVEGAKLGMAHMVGAGSVCFVHILKR